MKDFVLQIEASIEASISTSSSPSPASASHGPSSDHNIVAKQNAIIYLVLLFIRVISLYSSSFHYNSLSLSLVSLSLLSLSLFTLSCPRPCNFSIDHSGCFYFKSPCERFTPTAASEGLTIEIISLRVSKFLVAICITLGGQPGLEGMKKIE